MTDDPQPHGDERRIRVEVTFPISREGPYKAEVSTQTTVGIVLTGAMKHFKVDDDPQFTYVLTHDGTEEKNSTTIGAIAGEHHEVHFKLVKKITQG